MNVATMCDVMNEAWPDTWENTQTETESGIMVSRPVLSGNKEEVTGDFSLSDIQQQMFAAALAEAPAEETENGIPSEDGNSPSEGPEEPEEEPEHTSGEGAE